MQLTERYTFLTDKIQKKTLIILRKKYRINVSKFIRDAIMEKLQREKDSIFKNYTEIQTYLKKADECPF